MEFTYRSRKHIAKIALIVLVLILLPAFNFDIGNTISKYGNLEGISSHSLVLNQSNLLSNHFENTKNPVQKKQLLQVGLISIIAAFALLLSIWIYWNKLLCARRYTLVSLSVRLDE